MKIYAVTFTNTDGQDTLSRYFQTLHAARKWAKWLSKNDWAANARIMLGGQGGQEVK